MPKRILIGTVVSDKTDKTVVVKVERKVKHPLYGKIIRRSKKYHAHDEANVWKEGQIVRIETPRTIADGAQTQHLGHITFPIIQRDVNDILTVTDAQLVDSMRFFAERMKLIVEPTGALGFAAVRALGDELKGQRVGVLISGGNVDLARFCALINA